MNREEKRQAAEKKVEALRGFYIHLVVYAAVNTLLFLIDLLASPDSLWFFWPLLGWGIAIVVHAISVFGSGRPLGADWKERKVQRSWSRTSALFRHSTPVDP